MTKHHARADVIVVGGGLMGLSSALWLAKSGASVIVLEKDSPGQHASSLNAGGLRRLRRALPEIPLAIAAHQHWLAIADLVGDDCGLHVSSQIRVAEDEAALAQLRERAELTAGLGYTHEEIVDQQSLREMLPAIAPHCVGALVVRGDGHADPARAVSMFASACQQAGVVIRSGTQAQSVESTDKGWQVTAGGEQYESNWLVNASGAWANKLCEQIKEPVPLRAAALMMTLTRPLPRFVDAVIGCHGRALSLKQRDDGAVLIGGAVEGTADLASGQTTLDQAGLERNLQTARDLFTQMQHAQVDQQWAGIEGMLPDDIPVIGPSASASNLIHAFGFCGHGFLLAPEVGRIVSALVNADQPGQPIHAFSINRFAEHGGLSPTEGATG